MTLKTKSKSFWKKPEGVTGAIFLAAITAFAGYLIYTIGAGLIGFFTAGVGMYIGLAVLGLLIFFAIDSRSRKLVSYMFQSAMRWITGIFVQINPLGVLKNYVEDLKYNLKKMTRQMGKLRAQKHSLMEMVHNNREQIKSNMQLASEARDSKNDAVMILKSRKAGRLKESNVKFEDLLKQMEVMHRVLKKMRENSMILAEDIEDQVKMKEQEQKAIMASHSAMKSAMTIIRGDRDKKQLFDQALEVIADDVSNKVGEMERFMDMSEDFMKSIDLQNGIFEEKGLEMLEKWEKESTSLLLGDAKSDILNEVLGDGESLELKQKQKLTAENNNEYDDYFDE